MDSAPNVMQVPTLRILRISQCPSITTLPDLKESVNLEQLVIQDCGVMTEQPSLNTLGKLKKLYIGGFTRHINFKTLKTPNTLETLNYAWYPDARLPPNLNVLTNL